MAALTSNWPFWTSNENANEVYFGREIFEKLKSLPQLCVHSVHTKINLFLFCFIFSQMVDLPLQNKSNTSSKAQKMTEKRGT